MKPQFPKQKAIGREGGKMKYRQLVPTALMHLRRRYLMPIDFIGAMFALAAAMLLRYESAPQVMEGIEPRHALAATVFAFEKDLKKADIINKTFLHFA